MRLFAAPLLLVTVLTAGVVSFAATAAAANAPVITLVSPTSGGPGQTVIIEGHNLTPSPTVDFGSCPATITSADDHELQVLIPTNGPGCAGTVTLTVTTAAGTGTAPFGFTIVPRPVVLSVSPNFGPNAGGTPVIITGTGFTNTSAVDFGGIPATDIIVNSDSSITVVSPAGTGIVDVTVSTVGGTSQTSPADKFSYGPVISSVVPSSGPTAGGQAVLINGEGFTGTTSVDFGGTPAASYMVNSDTSISATTPAAPAGTVDITITSPAGTSPSTPNDRYSFYAVPTVTAVAPQSGPQAGGTTVLVTGTGFEAPGTTVFFGGNPGTGLVVNSDTSVTITSPAGTLGTVDVRVTNAGGTSATSAADQFTYLPIPAISSVVPDQGPLGGGTVVTITGSGFTQASAVAFGSTPAELFMVNSDTSVTATSPAGTGTVDVTVTTPGGTSATSPSDQFTYLPPPVVGPGVGAVSPSSGPAAGGTPVTITGSAFTGASQVSFGGTPGTGLMVNSDTSITVDSPAHAPGTVDVTVTTPGGTSTASSADQFTFVPQPVVTGVAPDLGPVAGGTPVTVTGSGFTNASAVDFGGTAGTGLMVNSDTSITIISPAHLAGTVDVTVVVPVGGTSATSPADQFSYLPVPVVTSVVPDQGPLAGGTPVTVTGSGFTHATEVDFGGTAGTGLMVNSDSSITITSPAEAAGTVDVTVMTPGGTSATSPADDFTYRSVPSVTGVAPDLGPQAGDTSVTITGSGFTAATAVSFGGVPATLFTVNTDSSITATSPAGTGTVDVTVASAGGTSATSPADQFTYLPVPAVTSVAPDLGPLAGGTPVTVTGSGFTHATEVDFGGVAGTGLMVDSDTSITITSPAEAAGTVDVTVITPGGTSASSPADQFTYLPVPAVTSVVPDQGPLGGGTSVAVTGSGFTHATEVDFGGTAGTGLIVNSDTSITITSPAEAAGTVDVTVMTPGGTSPTSPADQFTYRSIPTVTGVVPDQGPQTGGTSVTISGVGFAAATAVDFGGVPATLFTVNTDTSITATAPAGTGTVDVTVSSAGGTSNTTAADQFTYVPLPVVGPGVGAVNPNAGPTTGGTLVTITGSNLTGASAVSFGGTAGTGLMVNSDTSITITSPAHAAGTVDVTVTTVGGTSAPSSADQYTFVTPPVVSPTGPGPSAVNPNQGPTTGGTLVTISGSNLTGASAVSFGGTPATGVTVVNDSTVTATSPAHAAGTVDVTVTTPGGTSPTSPADQYTFVTPPVVSPTGPGPSAVNPNQGPTTGGTLVTISGSNLTGASAVSFGGTPATGVTVVNDSTVTATSPAHAAGTVDVTVTTPGGTSPTSSADQYTFVTPPVISPTGPGGSAVNPNHGSTLGGTLVTISGSNLTGATAVSFGGTPATGVTVVNDSTVTATSPAHAAGTVDVTVTTPGGTSPTSSADQYTFIPPPAVSGVSPDQGGQQGGTVVTVTGSGFDNVTSVDFGGDPPCTNLNVVSSTEITCTAPPHTPGTVDVTVVLADDVISATTPADQFTYLGSGHGYWLVASDGGIFSFGTAHFYGSTGNIKLNSPIVGMAATNDYKGYWLVAADGGIFAFGDAKFFGSMGGRPLNQPVVGMAPTADDRGYWLVAADGGIFAFGDARFHGSTGDIHLNAPIIKSGMTPTPDGGGYWLTSSDGGIFTFGDAHFYGSAGNIKLNKAIVGMSSTPDGQGYWLVAGDGGLFSYGSARFHGSMGGRQLNQPMVEMEATPDGNGYWMVASDGGVFAFGDAVFYGSTGNIKLNKPIEAMAAVH